MVKEFFGWFMRTLSGTQYVERSSAQVRKVEHLPLWKVVDRLEKGEKLSAFWDGYEAVEINPLDDAGRNYTLTGCTEDGKRFVLAESLSGLHHWLRVETFAVVEVEVMA